MIQNLYHSEEWKDIEGYEGRYQVSNLGRVKSLSRVTQLNGRVRTEPEKIMAVTYRSGYPTLILRKPGERTSKQVHRLVAEAFLPNPDGLPVVNHIDYDPTNNNVSNLEWCTQRDNVRWSAHKMMHPKSVCRPTNTGEKYISKTKSGKYRVAIYGRHGKVYWAGKTTLDKSFQTLEEAMKARDAFINGL